MRTTDGVWVLRDKAGYEVEEDQEVVDFRGEPGTVVGGYRPLHGSSTGRVSVAIRHSDGVSFVREYYPSVYGLKWVKGTA